ncbi:MAG: substrate-binding domain-containing protein, partial [Pseudolabrys sp.]|nr:substrate-binding domain-containing protein [Pseudolabrys sp.]
IAAGDSLIQWLVIPRLGAMLKSLPDVRFATLNLRTYEIIQQVADSRIDFGLVRQNAVIAGMKSASLGALSYVAVVPKELVARKRPPSFSAVLQEFPLALQTTDGQFTNQLREIALAAGGTFRPGLACQSFPQVFAAVKSGRFAAILPEIAAAELPPQSCLKIYGEPLLQLQREITLVWNPRVISVRPQAASIVAKIQTALRF